MHLIIPLNVKDFSLRKYAPYFNDLIHLGSRLVLALP